MAERETGLRDQAKDLIAGVVADFKAGLGEMKPTAEQMGMIERAADTLVASAILGINAPEDRLERIKQRVADAHAVLANIKLAKEIDADRLIRASIQNRVAQALEIAFAVVTAAL